MQVLLSIGPCVLHLHFNPLKTDIFSLWSVDILCQTKVVLLGVGGGGRIPGLETHC